MNKLSRADTECMKPLSPIDRGRTVSKVYSLHYLIRCAGGDLFGYSRVGTCSYQLLELFTPLKVSRREKESQKSTLSQHFKASKRKQVLMRSETTGEKCNNSSR